MSSRYSEDKLPTEERKEKEKRLETEQPRDQAEEKNVSVLPIGIVYQIAVSHN